MARTNKLIPNMVGGELSPLMYSRVDIPVYQKGLAKCENFIVLPQGGARFRNGTGHVKRSRLNRLSRLIPFQFSDQQAYVLEFTDHKMRVFKDNSAVTEAPKTLTAVTNANPGVFTSTGHGFVSGDEVQIAGIVGALSPLVTGVDTLGNTINGRFYLVVRINNDTFSLTTIEGTAIDTSALSAYSSGGTAARVYEIASPYEESQLDALQFTQNANEMYIADLYYAPYKLTRTAHTTWTLATYTRTSDPFVPTLAKAISAITLANPGVITSATHGFADGDIINIQGIVGTTQLNDYIYQVVLINTNTFSLKRVFAGKDAFGNNVAAGSAVDTTLYTAWVSGGTVNSTDKYPRAVTFTDSSRLVYAGTRLNPESFWASKSPSAGATAFADHTSGTAATDAIPFTLTPVHGLVDAIQWISNTAKSIIVGTYSAIRRIYGATEDESITPNGITAKSINAYGCALSPPVSNGANLFYIQRGNRFLRSLDYDISVAGYVTTDRNLVADHLTKGNLALVVEQQGSPDVIWGMKGDGLVLGLTFKEKEDISGWHRHYLGGSHTNSASITRSYGKVISIARMVRPGNTDQLWLCVERTIGGITSRSIEYLIDQPEYPIRSDFFTGQANSTTDQRLFENVLYETHKDSKHLDMSLTYDGSALGTSVSATMTPGAGATTVGSSVTFTASAAVFNSGMIGREIWKKYDANGNGGGRAVITAYTSTTVVTCRIIVGFDTLVAIPAGSWFLTANKVYGLNVLEGQSVGVVTDGAYHGDLTVASGSITLNDDVQASKIHIGFRYRGVLKTLNLDSGGVMGSAEAKIRSILQPVIRVMNTLGLYFGSDEYRCEKIELLSLSDITDRPTPLVTAAVAQTYLDSWSANEKQGCIIQEFPMPATVLGLDLFMETTDE